MKNIFQLKNKPPAQPDPKEKKQLIDAASFFITQDKESHKESLAHQA
jgi:hypothetical protein